MPSTKTNNAIKLSADIYSLEGKKVDSMALAPEVFNVEINANLIAKALKVQQSSERVTLGHTKTRAERRGGGRKPWRQKGTGRARHGSTRSPIWRKGGITFGPRSDKNFALKINAKERTKAMQGLLSTRALEKDGIVVVENFDLKEAKTKLISLLIKKLPSKRSHLLVVDKKNENLSLATRNMASLKTILLSNLNVKDLISHEQIVFSKSGMVELQKKFSKK